jgi:hypothetical protein
LAFSVFVISTTLVPGCGGAVSTSDAPQTAEETGSATLMWSAPTTYEDGSPLTLLAGFKVYYGSTPGIYTSVSVGNVNTYQIAGLVKGKTYFFTVTAYDAYGNESDYAGSVSKLII